MKAADYRKMLETSSLDTVVEVFTNEFHQAIIDRKVKTKGAAFGVFREFDLKWQAVVPSEYKTTFSKAAFATYPEFAAMLLLQQVYRANRRY